MLKKATKLDMLMMDTGATRLALSFIMDQRVRLSRAMAKNKPLFLRGIPEGKSQVIADTVLKALQTQQQDETLHLATICRLVEDVADRLNARETRLQELTAAATAAEKPVKPEFESEEPEPVVAE